MSLAASLLLAVLYVPAARAADAPPNIVLIMADDK